MAAKDDRPIADQITLGGLDAQVYEAIATLEFIGHEVTARHIASASNLDEDAVLTTLLALTGRGMLRTEKRGAALIYVPTHRGWSAAPDKAVNPSR